MLGVVDESTPAFGDGPFVYALGLVVLSPGQRFAIAEEFRRRLSRKNPFHWEQEGPRARGLFLDLVRSSKVRLALAAQITTTAEMNRSRAMLLRDHLLPAARQLDVDELLIESRSSAENNADTLTARNWARDQRVRLTHRFGTKDEPLTWLADGAAGLLSDCLLGRGAGELGQLTSAHKVVFLRHLVLA